MRPRSACKKSEGGRWEEWEGGMKIVRHDGKVVAIGNGGDAPEVGLQEE